MPAIGFRIEPSAFSWAVVEQREGQLVLLAKEKTPLPKALNEAEALTWLRHRINLLIDQQKPTAAAIRYPEPNAQKNGNAASTHSRLRAEGVVLEALQSAGVRVHTGPLVTISARLGTKSAKAYLDGQEFRGVKFNTCDKNLREAIIVAVSALEDCNGNQD